MNSVSDVRALLAAAAMRLGDDADARGEAALLLAHVLGRSRAWLFAWPEAQVDPTSEQDFQRAVDARVAGEPIAYLIGTREFWSLELEVNADVLIPRRETELLVELALARIPADRACRIADLGTGSGAVALALGRERPHAKILATDASAAALALARANATRLGIGNIRFAQGDWCAALDAPRFALIASNPPYIAADDPHLEQGDLRREPRSALASGTDGLDAIRTIAAGASVHLEADGWLLLEHGFDQGPRVRALLAERGFRNVVTERDHSGHDRVTLGQQ